ncbi:MAG: helix-turn-helix domain-containing protein [Pseudobdellovibrionaceae bacterium]
MNLLRENFNKILSKKGLKRKSVEEKTGMTQPELSRILNESRDPRLSTLKKIAHGLDVETWQLFIDESANEVGPLSEEEKLLVLQFRKIPTDAKRNVVKDTIDAFSE